AAPARPDQHCELAQVDVQVNAAQGLDLCVATAKHLCYVTGEHRNSIGMHALNLEKPPRVRARERGGCSPGLPIQPRRERPPRCLQGPAKEKRSRASADISRW